MKSLSLKRTVFLVDIRTHDLWIERKNMNVAVDSGFIVFNDYNYPLFSAMIAELGVEAQNSDMSFSVNNQVTGLQYNPSKKWSPINATSEFLNKKLVDHAVRLDSFYQDNKDIQLDQCNAELSIEDYLKKMIIQRYFAKNIYTQCGALWSKASGSSWKYSYKFVVSFFFFFSTSSYVAIGEPTLNGRRSKVVQLLI